MAENQNAWSLPIDVSGVGFFDPGSMFDRFPEGIFEMKIEKSSREPSKNGKADNIILDLACVGPKDFVGKKTRVYLNTADLDDKTSINAKKFKNVLACVAKDPAALEKGRVNISGKVFDGKNVLMHCQPAPEGAKTDDGKRQLDNLTIVTPDQAKKLKEAMTAKGPATGAGATATGAQNFDVKGGAAGAANGSGGAERPTTSGVEEAASDLA